MTHLGTIGASLFTPLAQSPVDRREISYLKNVCSKVIAFVLSRWAVLQMIGAFVGSCFGIPCGISFEFFGSLISYAISGADSKEYGIPLRVQQAALPVVENRRDAPVIDLPQQEIPPEVPALPLVSALVRQNVPEQIQHPPAIEPLLAAIPELHVGAVGNRVPPRAESPLERKEEIRQADEDEFSDNDEDRIFVDFPVINGNGQIQFPWTRKPDPSAPNEEKNQTSGTIGSAHSPALSEDFEHVGSPLIPRTHKPDPSSPNEEKDRTSGTIGSAHSPARSEDFEHVGSSPISPFHRVQSAGDSTSPLVLSPGSKSPVIESGKMWMKIDEKMEMPKTKKVLSEDENIKIFEETLAVIQNGHYLFEKAEKSFNLELHEDTLSRVKIIERMNKIEANGKVEFGTIFLIEEMSSLMMVQILMDYKCNPLVMVPVGSKSPGGGVERGSYSPEAMHCRQSNLFAALQQAKMENGYPIREYGGILIKKVQFFRTDALYEYTYLKTPTIVDIFASPPYDLREPLDVSTYYPGMKEKVRTFFRTALSNGNDAVVLNDYGSEFYRSELRTIANIYKEVLKESEFADVFGMVAVALGERPGAKNINKKSFIEAMEIPDDSLPDNIIFNREIKEEKKG
ncbi:MAG: poly(ADP-ribose) glycohydrolase domain-containing protein [Chlamydiota bacterium]